MREREEKARVLHYWKVWLPCVALAVTKEGKVAPGLSLLGSGTNVSPTHSLQAQNKLLARAPRTRSLSPLLLPQALESPSPNQNQPTPLLYGPGGEREELLALGTNEERAPSTKSRNRK